MRVPPFGGQCLLERDIRRKRQCPTSATHFSLSQKANQPEQCGLQTRPQPWLSCIVQCPPLDGCSNQVVNVPRICDLQPPLHRVNNAHAEHTGEASLAFPGPRVAQYSPQSPSGRIIVHLPGKPRLPPRKVPEADIVSCLAWPRPSSFNLGARRGGWTDQTLGSWVCGEGRA